MKKVFKPKLYRIVLNGFYGIFAGVLVTVIVGYISNNVVYAFIGGILAIILYVWWLIINRFITIKVDSTHLIVKKGEILNVDCMLQIRKVKNILLIVNLLELNNLENFWSVLESGIISLLLYFLLRKIKFYIF